MENGFYIPISSHSHAVNSHSFPFPSWESYSHTRGIPTGLPFLLGNPLPCSFLVESTKRPNFAVQSFFTTAIRHTFNVLTPLLCRQESNSTLTLILYGRHAANIHYYWYSITPSLFYSRVKTFLFCKSSPPLPSFLLQD